MLHSVNAIIIRYSREISFPDDIPSTQTNENTPPPPVAKKKLYTYTLPHQGKIKLPARVRVIESLSASHHPATKTKENHFSLVRARARAPNKRFSLALYASSPSTLIPIAFALSLSLSLDSRRISNRIPQPLASVFLRLLSQPQRLACYARARGWYVSICARRFSILSCARLRYGFALLFFFLHLYSEQRRCFFFVVLCRRARL